MPLTPAQQTEIDNILNKIGRGVKTTYKTNSQEIEELKTNIRSLLEKNAELYNRIRKEVQVIRGDHVGTPSGNSIAIVAVMIVNQMATMDLNMLQRFTQLLFNVDVQEDSAKQLLFRCIFPGIYAVLATAIYYFIRNKTETAVRPALAHVTRVKIDSLIDGNKKLQPRLEAIKEKLEEENQLLTKCMAAQTKDTWWGMAGGGARTFATGFWSGE